MTIEHRFVAAMHVLSLSHDDLVARDADNVDGAVDGTDVVFQTSTIDALLAGAFDGDCTVGELLAHGDFGLGTVDALDGELVVVDGAAWRCDVSGDAHRVADDTGTPFAVVTRFRPSVTVDVAGPADRAAIEDRVAALVAELTGESTERACTAVRVDGRFASVRARSIARQRRPYPTLAEAAAHQHEFTLGGTGRGSRPHVAGTMVGFRFADAAEGIEVPGFHWHFVTDDRRHGGHVLECTVVDATVAVDHLAALTVELPPTVDVQSEGSGTQRDDIGAIEG